MYSVIYRQLQINLNLIKFLNIVLRYVIRIIVRTVVNGFIFINQYKKYRRNIQSYLDMSSPEI